MLKVSISYSAGYKAVGTLVYAWPDAIDKARMADRILRERLDRMGARFDEIRTEYVGWNSTHGHLAGPPPPTCRKSSCASAFAARTAKPSRRSHASWRR
jgi:hypothetical protein